MFVVKSSVETHHPIAPTIGMAVLNHMSLLEIYELPSILVKDERDGTVKRLNRVRRDGREIAWERAEELTGDDF